MKNDAQQRLNISSNSAFYLAEVIIRATLCGMTFYEVPVCHYPRRFGKPTGSNFLIIFGRIKGSCFISFQEGAIRIT